MNIRATGLAIAALLALGICHWLAQTNDEFKFWATMAGIAALGLIAFIAGIAALITPLLRSGSRHNAMDSARRQTSSHTLWRGNTPFLPIDPRDVR